MGPTIEPLSIVSHTLGFCRHRNSRFSFVPAGVAGAQKARTGYPPPGGSGLNLVGLLTRRFASAH
jgi:hypothetical protein